MSDQYKEIYMGVVARYEVFSRVITDSLKTLLEKNKIKAQVEYRVKTLESFLEKITRKNYEDPLGDMPDLAGIRVICNFESDIQKVAKIIKKEFLLQEDIDKTQSLDVDRMGYSGRHMIVMLNPRQVSHNSALKDLKCEIQIKTVFQHAWSVAEHSLIYKSNAAVPALLKRKINQVSVMMEMAQSVFEEVLFEKSKYQEKISKDITHEKFQKSLMGMDVDFETLKLYLLWKYPKLPFSENLHNKILASISASSYSYIQDIEDICVRADKFIKIYKEKIPECFRYSNDYLSKSLGYMDRSFRERYEFSERTMQAFSDYDEISS